MNKIANFLINQETNLPTKKAVITGVSLIIVMVALVAVGALSQLAYAHQLPVQLSVFQPLDVLGTKLPMLMMLLGGTSAVGTMIALIALRCPAREPKKTLHPHPAGTSATLFNQDINK